MTGAISEDPGLINHTEKLRLKISKKEKTFKIFCLKNKLIKKLIAKEEEKYRNQKSIISLLLLAFQPKNYLPEF